ncbi:MAG: two pore domain potassium channel family protein [Clostridiaceae bacterium]|nr:two pore domain potassium channel family protein [Clostridiaceae bacterium]
MKRHFQVIFEAILSIMIILEIFFLIIVSIGFIAGLKANAVFSFGFYDVLIGILILLDFVVFRYRHREHLGGVEFIRRNWSYLVSIFPLFFICFNLLDLYQYGLIIGIIGIIRLFALFNVLKIISVNVLQYPKKTKLDYATIVLLLVLLIGSYIFFLVEKGVNPTVLSYESALWYAIVSMTTTGYGDIVPVTLVGHILGVLFILTGMGYVSLVTATLAYSFIDLFRKESKKAINNLGDAADGLKDSFSVNETKMDQVLKKLEELEKKVDELEKEK